MEKQSNKQREEKNKEVSKIKFEGQKNALIKPYGICFLIETLLFVILMCLDGPSVIFDDSSILFSVLLIVMILMTLLSLVILYFATTTTHLLITFSLNQLCIFPLIIAYFLKYEEMKNCSSYHMILIFFIFMIIYLVMTTILFNMKSKYTTLEKK